MFLRNWMFTHAFSESPTSTHEKNGLARRGAVNEQELATFLTKNGQVCCLWWS